MLKLALAVVPLGLLAVVGSGPAADTTTSTAGLTTGPSSVPLAGSGCRHTIKVRNEGTRTVTISWSRSEVRNRVGWWKQIYGGGFGVFYQAPSPAEFPVAAGKSHSWIYTTDFGCSANRRWRFALKRSDGNEAMLYYPSSTSFSSQTTVDLGNLGRSTIW